MNDSMLPPNDREWLTNLFRTELAKVETKIEQLRTEFRKLDERQRRTDEAWRDSTATDLDHERRIADAQLRLERIGASSGAVAGKESAESTAKKWGAVYALIALVHALVSTFAAQKEAPPVVIPKESHAPTSRVEAR